MYYIYSRRRGKLNKIKTFLKMKDIETVETKDNDYIFVYDDPTNILPAFLKAGIKIEKIPENEYYLPMFKNYGALAFLFEKFIPKEGMLVKVNNGIYKGLNIKGIVKEVGKNTCTVEISVWGRITKINVKFEDLEPVQEELLG